MKKFEVEIDQYTLEHIKQKHNYINDAEAVEEAISNSIVQIANVIVKEVKV